MVDRGTVFGEIYVVEEIHDVICIAAITACRVATGAYLICFTQKISCVDEHFRYFALNVYDITVFHIFTYFLKRHFFL